MEAINANVNRYVKENDTTKDAVAKGIGISRSSFYDKLAGKSPWMLEEAIKLSDVMGCTVQELITMPA